MKKVFIKYNPYKLETEIMVDGKKLKENSKIGEKSAHGSRLQEWVEELPQLLIDEYNDRDYEIAFHGTLLDYEDLKSVFPEDGAHEEIKFDVKERIHAKETSDKEVLIDNVFSDIQKGPFDELRHEQIISAFQHAKSSDFEVLVVATMSAGKSTLINAMIGKKLMPSKQEACTAIITRIKDTSNDEFELEVYDENESKIESPNIANLDNLNMYNSCPIKYRCEKRTPSCPEGGTKVGNYLEEKDKDKLCPHWDERTPNVLTVCLYGNIPFVSSDDVSLVLIDTPGPNNSRDPRHKKVQSELLSKSSKALVLYIMTGEFGTDDDNALLKRVAESMAVGGKQSKDRFIFVVNKFDSRQEEDGDTNPFLERVRSYLKTHGVVNPNLFPAAALPALSIRMIMSGADVDDTTIDETDVKVKKLNRNAKLHLEKYAPLPASIRGEIKIQLEDARSTYDGRANENPKEALIHTGVVSIEAAIRQYVQKYAKTAKIKNIVDTFMGKLEELGCFEETKRELAKNREEGERIVKQIAAIREKIDSANEAKKFKDTVDGAIIKINDDSKGVVEGIIQKFNDRVIEQIESLHGREIDIDDAEDEVARLEKFAKRLEPDFEVELDELIRDNLVNTSNVLLESYRNKLASLAEEVDIKNLMGVKIDPLKLMSGSIVYDQLLTKKLIKSKTVEDGAELVEVSRKPIFGLGLRDKLFGKKKEWRTKYKTVNYISGSEMAQLFLKQIQKNIYDNGDNSLKYALQQSKRIAERFNLEFKHLDDVLKSKLNELESYATDKEKAEERIRESERRLKWLEEIKAKVELILEI